VIFLKQRYAEAIPGAAAAFAPVPPPTLAVTWSAEAEAQLAAAPSRHAAFRELAEQVLRQDPRPTWQQRTQKQPDKVFCLHLADIRVTWRHDPTPPAEADSPVATREAPPPSGTIVILACEPLTGDNIPSLFADGEHPRALSASLAKESSVGIVAAAATPAISSSSTIGNR
jgi:hypothetical protein